jgi:hypothetical protein
MNPSLIQLSNFVLENDAERAIYNIDPSEKSIIQTYLDDAKSSWSKGKYYLGGQIPLNPNDEITPELVKKAWKIFADGDTYYCNSFEYASVIRAQGGLISIEKIVNKYIEIQKLRVLNELEKTKLISDINKEIVSFI